MITNMMPVPGIEPGLPTGCHSQPFLWWHTTSCGWISILITKLCCTKACRDGGGRGAVQSKFTSSQCGWGADPSEFTLNSPPPIPILIPTEHSCSKTGVHKTHNIQYRIQLQKLVYIKLLMYLFWT